MRESDWIHYHLHQLLDELKSGEHPSWNDYQALSESTFYEVLSFFQTGTKQFQIEFRNLCGLKSKPTSGKKVQKTRWTKLGLEQKLKKLYKEDSKRMMIFIKELRSMSQKIAVFAEVQQAPGAGSQAPGAGSNKDLQELSKALHNVVTTVRKAVKQVADIFGTVRASLEKGDFKLSQFVTELTFEDDDDESLTLTGLLSELFEVIGTMFKSQTDKLDVERRVKRVKEINDITEPMWEEVKKRLQELELVKKAKVRVGAELAFAQSAYADPKNTPNSHKKRGVKKNSRSPSRSKRTRSD